jgi:hypothetical protein
VQIASALLSNRRVEEMYFEPSAVASKPRSINDLPDETLLKILSHFEPEELIFPIARVCKRWNHLSRDVTIWKEKCYSCDQDSDVVHVVQVRYAALLGFRTN